ncbi:MAG: DDE-type integrase/transposase/recombinase [Candidatus Lokiarchaeota archaeon]|nr:DDE-type integrase/transposase/recombinase [Candidatus Harpocratesius repetitus]
MSNLFHAHGKLVDIARNHQISPSLLSYLYTKFQQAIIKQVGLQNLVNKKQKDHAIAIDETFLKINGKTYYIIMATGYASHKILGLKVSQTRKMEDMLEVFNEAEKNTSKPITIITADAWNGTQALAKYLDRPITISIHKHKKPYEKIVVKRYEYDGAFI